MPDALLRIWQGYQVMTHGSMSSQIKTTTAIAAKYSIKSAMTSEELRFRHRPGKRHETFLQVRRTLGDPTFVDLRLVLQVLDQLTDGGCMSLDRIHYFDLTPIKLSVTSDLSVLIIHHVSPVIFAAFRHPRECKR